MPLVSAVCLWSVAASPCAFVERKEEKAVANVLPIDDVAAVVALHQNPSDLKTTGGANCCGQLRIRLSFGFVFFAEVVPPNSVVAIGRATVCM